MSPAVGMEGFRDRIQRDGGMGGLAVGMKGRWEPAMGDRGDGGTCCRV